jgi:hypothetical protein
MSSFLIFPSVSAYASQVDNPLPSAFRARLMIIVQGRWMSLTGERGLLPLVVTETKTPRCRQVVPLSPPRSGGCARCAPISGSSG